MSLRNTPTPARPASTIRARIAHLWQHPAPRVLGPVGCVLTGVIVTGWSGHWPWFVVGIAAALAMVVTTDWSTTRTVGRRPVDSATDSTTPPGRLS